MTMTDDTEVDRDPLEINLNRKAGDPGPYEGEPEPYAGADMEPQPDEAVAVFDAHALPEINGILPTGLDHVLKRKVVGAIPELFHKGQRVVLVVEAVATTLAMDDDDKLIQTLELEGVFAAGELGRDFLRDARSAYRTAQDAALGRVELPFDETEQPSAFVAADGTVMTPSELAEVRGELIEDARDVDIDPSGDEFAVEFADGSRGLWPSDWDGSGQSLASVGGFMRPPGKRDTVQVVRIRTVDGGELLDEWTEADEAARLGRLELDVAAREDAAAVAELEAGRGKGAKGRKR